MKKFQRPMHKQAEEQIVAAAYSAFKAILGIRGAEATIYPWYDNVKKSKRGLSLASLQSIKASTSQVLRSSYLNRGFNKIGYDSCSFGVHVGHNMTSPTRFEKAVREALEEEGMIGYKASKHERTISIGFLQNSFREMDTQRLQEAVYEDTGVEVEARFRPIGEGKRLEQDQIVRAVQIDVPTHYDHKDRALVKNVFRGEREHANAVNKLSLIPLHLVPSYNKVSNEDKDDWYDRKKVQAEFLKLVESKVIRNVFARNIHRIVVKEASMRDIMMAVTVPQTNAPLFVSVNQSKNSEHPSVTYFKENEEEVIRFLSGPMITLLHQLPEHRRKDEETLRKFKQFFTLEAKEEASEQRWIPERGTFSTEDGEYLKSSRKEIVVDIEKMKQDLEEMSMRRMKEHLMNLDLETLDSVATDTTSVRMVDDITVYTTDLNSLLGIEGEDDMEIEDQEGEKQEAVVVTNLPKTLQGGHTTSTDDVAQTNLSSTRTEHGSAGQSPAEQQQASANIGAGLGC
jgi:hypothetical protein